MELLTNIEEESLGFPELKRMLGKDAAQVRLLQYDQLKPFGTVGEMLGGKVAVIVLLTIEAPNAPRVGHWIAVIDMGDHYEHFDSYGLSVDEELGLTHEERYLSRILRGAEKRVQSSGTRYQAMREGVNTCGRWCVTRIRLRQLDMAGFKQLIQQAHSVPDVTVAMMTLFL